MRVLGSVLMGIGILVGVSVSLALIAGVSLPGVSWLLAVGLVKMTYLASVGFIGAGAFVQRLARRDAARALRAGD